MTYVEETKPRNQSVPLIKSDNYSCVEHASFKLLRNAESVASQRQTD